ncbi:MAG: hypothetical protein SNH27_17600 [Rikenellaceae bacterium]
METYEIKTAREKADLGVYPLSRLSETVDFLLAPMDGETRENYIIGANQTINSIIRSSNKAFEIAKQSDQLSTQYEFIMASLYKLSERIKQYLRGLFDFNKNITITNEMLEEYSQHRELIFNADIAYSLSSLEDTFEMQEFKEWASIRDLPLCELFYKVDKYICWLDELYYDEIGTRDLKREIDNYKPAKEYRIENYFDCNNYEKLRAILRQDIRGKRGKAVAMVLVALDRAGCKMIGDFSPLLKNILTPLYGVCGSRQGVTEQLPKIKDVTEKTNPKTEKLLKEMSEKYRLQLQ